MRWMHTAAPSIRWRSFCRIPNSARRRISISIDITNSSYYDLGKRHWVIARQTRYGQERAFGDGRQQLIPLPERLYAGGATSHRGFAINAAGPRDPQTGYPIGGAAVAVNTLELRTPYPNLPLVGNNLGFVFFHDMGNIFSRSRDVWPSFHNFHQPYESSAARSRQ